MNIVMVHYHLSRGGVTQTIANHLRALDRVCDTEAGWKIAVLHGGRRDGWPDDLSKGLKHVKAIEVIVPEIDYDERHVDGGPVLGGKMVDALTKAGFAPAETILHVHNATIGKSPSTPGAITHVAEHGFGVVQQIHDFAEDFRPENYRLLLDTLSPDDPDGVPERLYPQAPHIHYAVLNSRDRRTLLAAGVPNDRLHIMPNPVFPIEWPGPKDKIREKLHDVCGVPLDRKLMVYPVRIIRRKNMGEALLWSILAGPDWHLAITQAPRDGIELTAYTAWKELAQRLGLNMSFEIGLEGMAIEESLTAADRILTTSIAEGFGMAFLEAWLAHRKVIGRDLPHITSDFVANGIRYEGLGPYLAVPLDWIGIDAFREPFESGYPGTVSACGRPAPSPESLREGIDAFVVDGYVDFVRLSNAMQRKVVERAHTDPVGRQALLDANSWIDPALNHGDRLEALINHNENVVREEYGLAACGRRLLDLYAAVQREPRGGSTTALPYGERVLEAFLSLKQFHPFRVEGVD